MTTVRSWAWDRLDSDAHGLILQGRSARLCIELIGSLVIAGATVICRAVVDQVQNRSATSQNYTITEEVSGRNSDMTKEPDA